MSTLGVLPKRATCPAIEAWKQGQGNGHNSSAVKSDIANGNSDDGNTTKQASVTASTPRNLRVLNHRTALHLPTICVWLMA